MASDKPINSNHTVPSNVKIKVEPGTSMPVPLKNIKMEPGLSTTTRLTSFRLPRDLTLGGNINIKTEKPKKVYIPNLNAQRAKKKDDGPQNESSTKSGRGRDNRGRGRGNERGRNDRGRGRGQPSNLIQSAGVWSTGIANTPVRHSGGGGGGSRDRDSDRSSQECLQKPKLDLNRVFDKAKEEEELKLLLKDDFIDDESAVDFDNGPVVLPMTKEAKVYKKEPKAEINVEEGEVDKKPIILENGEVLEPSKKDPKIKVPQSDADTKREHQESVLELSKNKSSYILMQFPDCLPGFIDSAEETKPNRSQTSNNDRGNENKAQTEFCTLNDLKPGAFGTLEILSSGKARLRVGENMLLVDVGSHISFRQDLVAAKLDTEKLNGDLINIGQVSNTLICSPDWESMLAKL